MSQKLIFCPALRQHSRSCPWQRCSCLFIWLSLRPSSQPVRGPWLVETLTASCSGKHLRQRQWLSSRFDSWLPLRHHLGDRSDPGASVEHPSFSITRCRHRGDWPFHTTKKRSRFELKFDNELISVPTAANHTKQAFQLSVTSPGL